MCFVFIVNFQMLGGIQFTIGLVVVVYLYIARILKLQISMRYLIMSNRQHFFFFW